MELLSEQIRHKQYLSSFGKPIDTIINIGIGGSDLGPKLVIDALENDSNNDIACYFVANVDAQDILSALKKANPETTLFILTSKSFSTKETLSNAKIAINWLKQNNCSEPLKHLYAVTSNKDAALAFGIESEQIFSFWPWVGGRYSVWSAVGLPIAIKLGMEPFLQFLSGASAMDQHFKDSDFAGNIPVILGLLDVWYGNFFRSETLAIVAYDQSLDLLTNYLSQLMMESNGKSVDNNGEPISYKTSAIIWGSIGTNAQHAFFQLLHQGTHLVPVDFLLALSCSHEHKEEHTMLVANCIAQSKALMLGDEAKDENTLHRSFSGNRPSTTIAYQKLDAYTLGMLLALYEHRTFVQACLCNINAFDQWGVELGKKLANDIELEIQSAQLNPEHDSSTKQLILKSLENGAQCH